jgi:hypothetical protein
LAFDQILRKIARFPYMVQIGGSQKYKDVSKKNKIHIQSVANPD